ncbi:MAG: carboxypeptidase M32, partial [Acidobacteria bacterium]|nr:carboxypeptidase M32 [Acidobacteriota bacterium]
FPTYTLGTLAASQLFEAAERELGSLEEQFRRGEFAPLLGWLRREIHQHGRFYTAAEVIERATGRSLEADAFLRHIRRNVEEAYPA